MNTDLPMTIAIDLKKMRIRIHKKVLHTMGAPKYIQLLVNPKTKSVAIRAVSQDEPHGDAERIRPLDMMSENSIELYSKVFVQMLTELVEDINTECTYRLHGNFVKDQNMAVFSLETLEIIDLQDGENNV